MSNTKVTAEVEINFKDGARTISMEQKRQFHIEDCEQGKVIVLNMKNGETYTGFFNGIDGDDDVMLGSLTGKGAIGLKIYWIENYFEEIKS